MNTSFQCTIRFMKKINLNWFIVVFVKRNNNLIFIYFTCAFWLTISFSLLFNFDSSESVSAERPPSSTRWSRSISRSRFSTWTSIDKYHFILQKEKRKNPLQYQQKTLVWQCEVFFEIILINFLYKPDLDKTNEMDLFHSYSSLNVSYND